MRAYTFNVLRFQELDGKDQRKTQIQMLRGNGPLRHVRTCGQFRRFLSISKWFNPLQLLHVHTCNVEKIKSTTETSQPQKADIWPLNYIADRESVITFEGNLALTVNIHEMVAIDQNEL